MSVRTRRIWLCADDYGMAPGVNDAIRQLIAKRRLNATSVMTAATHLDRVDADALVDVNIDGQAAIGLHVTLTAPFKPLSAALRSSPLPNRNTSRSTLSPDGWNTIRWRSFDASMR